jgi:hypothetical protein
MKKIITILALVFCLTTQAQSSHALVKVGALQNHQSLQQKQMPFGKAHTNNARLGSTNNSTQSQTQTFIAIYDSIYNWNWDTLTSVWNIAGKNINFVYDAHLNMTGYLNLQWTGSAWLNSSLYTFNYDANNNQTSNLTQIWSGSWTNQYLQSYTYSATNLQTSSLLQFWSSGAWGNEYLDNYAYDANNNQISDTTKTWSAGAWANYFLSCYTYDANNNQISDTEKTWSAGAWVYRDLKLYTYDANNNKTSYIFKIWSSGVWVNDFQETYTYDAHNNELSMVEKSWDGTAWSILADKGNFTYYGNNNTRSQEYKFYNTAGTKVNGGDSSYYFLNGACVSLVPHICIVSTDSASNYKYNVISWDNTGYSHVDSFIVYRYDVTSTSYLRIGAVSKHALSQFIDTAFSIGGPNGGNPQVAGWRYKLAIRDTCGFISAKSPYHQSTFVQNTGSAFSWTAYVDSEQVNLPTGYSFLRDDNSTGVWHVIANVATLSCTDPNYLSYPNGSWRVDALGFNCNPTTARLAGSGNNSVDVAKVRSHSNQNNNRGGTTGLKQLSISNSSVAIYPNPNNGSFTIEPSSATKQTMQVYDVNSKLVLSQLVNGKTSIDASSLSDGVYTINLISNEGVVNKKLVIVR